MKPLLPSLKEKKRYVVFEVIGQPGRIRVADLIMASASRLLGELGMARANIYVMNEKWDSGTRKGVLRVNRKYVEHAKAALALVDEGLVMRAVGVSGTLKKAMGKFMG